MAAIAFFDLDRTLIAINSASAWMRHERRAGRLGTRDSLRAAGWLALYHLGHARMDDVVRSAVATLAGRSAAEFEARVRAFWASEVAGTVRPGAAAVLHRHRSAGDRCVLLTAASLQLGRAAAEHLHLDDVLANEFEVADGVFTGRAAEPLCFGAGKVHHATRYAARHGVALADCTFYTDSYSDLRALEVVGTPVCVAPDPRLRRAARARGWRIESWETAPA